MGVTPPVISLENNITKASIDTAATHACGIETCHCPVLNSQPSGAPFCFGQSQNFVKASLKCHLFLKVEMSLLSQSLYIIFTSFPGDKDANSGPQCSMCEQAR
jgi:hypothetical protein